MSTVVAEVEMFQLDDCIAIALHFYASSESPLSLNTQSKSIDASF